MLTERGIRKARLVSLDKRTDTAVNYKPEVGCIVLFVRSGIILAKARDILVIQIFVSGLDAVKRSILSVIVAFTGHNWQTLSTRHISPSTPSVASRL